MFNLFGQAVGKDGAILGCDVCPSNAVPGIRKVKGLERIQQRDAMLWAMCPGEHENKQGLELVGPAGALLWKALGKWGLVRKDFDVQNVVRCRPLDEEGRNRDPSKRELACCSVHNSEALDLNRGNAKVHVILGDVAGIQLLGKAYQKECPIFWHEPWDAYILVNWHPSYLLRKGGEGTGWEFQTWRERFRAIQLIREHPGRWGFIKSRPYQLVRTLAEFDKMEKFLHAEQTAGRRVSFDIEDGHVEGKKVLLMGGFGVGHYTDPKDWRTWKGRSWSVVLDHPEARYEPSHVAALKGRIKALIEDGDLKKSLQNGSYDCNSVRAHLGATLNGYDYDTQYGTFIRYSFLRACGLEPLTYLFFPEFADYKETVSEWPNYADAPLEQLLLRNGGDCEITQRLEQRFAPHIPHPLVMTYIHAGKTLDRMEGRGPILDWKEWKKAKEIIPKMVAKLDRQLQQVSGDPHFNVNAPAQVAWLVYDVLKLPQTEAGRSTKKEVLELLQAQTGNRTLDIVIKRRGLGKIEGTYLDGFAKSASMHDDELRTIWWLTGAVTGRLRSGKGDKGEGQGITNLQNLHGNPLMQNLLVSDRNWRIAMEES